MAADLVERSDIPQTFVHDLESFFWVLLWMVLTRVKTSWPEEVISSFIHETMNSRVYSGFGGRGKIDFLVAKVALNENRFKISGNSVLRDLLEGLQSLLAARHQERPFRKSNSFVKQMNEEQLQQAVKQYEEGLEKLKNHDEMISILEEALFSQKYRDTWPPGDGSEHRLTPSLATGSSTNCELCCSKMVYMASFLRQFTTSPLYVSLFPLIFPTTADNKTIL
jgi:hypothetical protein